MVIRPYVFVSSLVRLNYAMVVQRRLATSERKHDHSFGQHRPEGHASSTDGGTSGMDVDGSGKASQRMRAALIQYRAGLEPMLLLHTIREAQSALVAATSPEVRETPSGESQSKFLAKLPRLWRQGEVRPTH